MKYPHNKYIINNEVLLGLGYENDLGVIVRSDPDLKKQCMEGRN